MTRMKLEHSQNSTSVFSRMAITKTVTIPGTSTCTEITKMVYSPFGEIGIVRDLAASDLPSFTLSTPSLTSAETSS